MFGLSKRLTVVIVVGLLFLNVVLYYFNFRYSANESLIWRRVKQGTLQNLFQSKKILISSDVAGYDLWIEEDNSLEEGLDSLGFWEVGSLPDIKTDKLRTVRYLSIRWSDQPQSFLKTKAGGKEIYSVGIEWIGEESLEITLFLNMDGLDESSNVAIGKELDELLFRTAHYLTHFEMSHSAELRSNFLVFWKVFSAEHPQMILVDDVK